MQAALAQRGVSNDEIEELFASLDVVSLLFFFFLSLQSSRTPEVVAALFRTAQEE